MQSALNLTRVDRLGYVVGGVALIAWALTRPSLARSSAAGVGGWLLYQAATGRNPMFTPLGIRVNRAPAETDAGETIVVEETIAIARPRTEVYRFWRRLENLPRIAPQLQSVEQLDEARSRWLVKGPRGGMLEWESEITRDEPDRELAWRMTRGEKLSHFGSVLFQDAPGGRGTAVKVHLEYVPPAGSLGTAIARVMGHSPQRVVAETLRRLRQLLETGEIATTEGQPSARH